MSEKRIKVGYASCEYVDEDRRLSVWWVSRFSKTGLTIVEGFNSFPCVPVGDGNIDNPYSEIKFYQDGHEFLGHDEEEIISALDEDFLEEFQPNSWDGEAKKLLEIYGSDISQRLLEILFHKKILRQKKDSNLKLPTPRGWTVTAILKEDLLFSIVSNKYSEESEWITYNNEDYDEFRAVLENFEIIASEGARYNYIPALEFEQFLILLKKNQTNRS